MLVVSLPSSPLRRPRRIAALALAAIVLAGACSSDVEPSAVKELDGTPVKVGGGSAYAYVITNGGVASSMGIAMTPSALNGLPSADTAWDLPMPAGANVAPIDHATLNWNWMGHPPGPYQLPHFDFHFYTISSSAQAAIQPGPDNTPVPAADAPPDYISGVEAVPDMGVHWVDTTAAELHGQTFDRTFIYGFYHGNMVFVEPMATRAFLSNQPNTMDVVKQPQAFQKPGAYPRYYSAHIDPGSGTIRVSLDSLVTHG